MIGGSYQRIYCRVSNVQNHPATGNMRAATAVAANTELVAVSVVWIPVLSPLLKCDTGVVIVESLGC